MYFDVLSGNTPEGIMSGCDDGSERVTIQEGVLAAVIRVASVSAPGTRELVLELKQPATRSGASFRKPSTARFLTSVFCDGLSADGLKRLMHEQLRDREQLAELKRGVDILKATHVDDLDNYQRLVLKAADAAARTQTGSGLLSRRITYLEKIAIGEICAVFRLSASRE